MFKKFILFLTLILLVLSERGFAQDPHFSQFYANSLYLNPAFAGSAVCPRLSLSYRNQWPAISGAYVTYSAAYDQHFDALGGGLGLLIMNDQAGEGVLTSTTVSAMYAKRIKVSREFYVRLALEGTYFQKKIDWDKLTFGDMINPKLGFIYATGDPAVQLGTDSKSGTDFSFGALGYTDVFFGGFAVHHLTEPDEGLYGVSKLPMKVTIHGGAEIPLENNRRRGDDVAVLAPQLMYMQQQDFKTLNFGLYFKKIPFVGGLWYRYDFENSDALIVLAGYQYNKVRIGYSYDITVSELSSVSGGAHEVSFVYQFNCPQKKKRYKRIVCPSF